MSEPARPTLATAAAAASIFRRRRRGAQVDLCALSSVRDAAAKFKASHDKLHLLVNNAAVMATPFALTPDGLEEQMAATHFGHFALTGALIDRLRASAPARIVNVSSLMHEYSGDIDFERINERRPAWRIYSEAKLANLLFSLELKRRLAARAPGVIVASAHPGYTATNLQLTPGKGPVPVMQFFNSLFAQSVSVGAQPQLYAALGSDIESGDYCGPSGLMHASGPATKVPRSARAFDEAAAAKLWAVSAKLTGIDFLAE